METIPFIHRVFVEAHEEIRRGQSRVVCQKTRRLLWRGAAPWAIMFAVSCFTVSLFATRCCFCEESDAEFVANTILFSVELFEERELRSIRTLDELTQSVPPIMDSIPKDPWGRSFLMLRLDEKPVVVSRGAKGILGDDDDIVAEAPLVHPPPHISHGWHFWCC